MLPQYMTQILNGQLQQRQMLPCVAPRPQQRSHLILLNGEHFKYSMLETPVSPKMHLCVSLRPFQVKIPQQNLLYSVHEQPDATKY